MNSESKPWPLSLPEKGEGLTRKMQSHLNFGDAGGAGLYLILDETGRQMPFQYQYDTRKGGLTGYSFLNGPADQVMSWTELREAWPEWLEVEGKKLKEA